MIDSMLTSTYPKQNVGDTASVVVGSMAYDFGDYRIFPTSLPSFTDGGLLPQTATVSAGADRLRVVSYNLENLNANENDLCDGKPDTAVADGRFAREGQHIAINLGAPDVLGVEEIQTAAVLTTHRLASLRLIRWWANRRCRRSGIQLYAVIRSTIRTAASRRQYRQGDPVQSGA